MKRTGLRHKFLWVAGMIPAVGGFLLLTGCATPERPSDITLDELEARMVHAMDPDKEYRNAYSYLQRQNVEEKGFFSTKQNLVEARFQRPDKFKVIVYEENQPQSAIISKGGKAWTIDYPNGIITELFGNDLAKVKIMMALGHPDNDYDQLFEKVDMSIVQLDDDGEDGAEYYKLTCYSGLPGQLPFIIYVNCELALPKRMVLDFMVGNRKIHYVNDIVEYQNFGGVRIPTLCKITDGDREYTSRVVGYMLNPKFKDDEFDIPHFDPLLMELKRQRLKRGK